ncbi:MAG: PorP/SprF family type IX secretion system membrane protein [Candidatus Cyclobacteriaceae bacterium M3_2C_046]
MKKTILFILIFFVPLTWVKAQEQLQFSQFVNNTPALNPAFTGMEDNITMMSGFKRQWSGIDLAPTTYYAGFSGTLNALKTTFSDQRTLRLSIPRFFDKLQNEVGAISHGVGVMFNGDHMGPFHGYGMVANYALIYNFSATYKVAIGTGLSLNYQRFDPSQVMLYTPGQDQIYQDYLGRNQDQLNGHLNLGISLVGHRLFLGYATHQLVGLIDTRMNRGDNAGMVHFLTGGVNIRFGKEYTWQPAFNLIVNNQANATTFSSRLKFRELFWGGLGYQLDQSVAFMAGFRLSEAIMFGYNYDLPISDIGIYSGGSHELTLRVTFYSDRVSRNLLW